MEGGTVIYNTQGPLVSRTTRFHPMVKDWFTYGGCVFDTRRILEKGPEYGGRNSSLLAQQNRRLQTVTTVYRVKQIN
jgi:hypothetical protein